MTSSDSSALQGLKTGNITLNGGMQNIPITSNISWSLPFFPWNRPGYKIDNLTHVACISTNATILTTCCPTVSGNTSYYVNIDGQSLGSSAANGTNPSDGLISWCTLPSNLTYNDHYNSQPDIVTAFEACFNATASATANAGHYASNITIGVTDLWQCELASNYSGSNTYGIPTLYATTSGADRMAKLGGWKGGMAMGLVGVLGLAMTLTG